MYNNEYTFSSLSIETHSTHLSVFHPSPRRFYPPFSSPPFASASNPAGSFLRLCISRRSGVIGHFVLGLAVIFQCNDNPEALFCAGHRFCERARARAFRRHVHKCIYTYNYIDCTADEFADCTIYDCIGSIKRNENARTTCHTRVTLRIASPSTLALPFQRWIKILDSLQNIWESTRSKRSCDKHSELFLLHVIDICNIISIVHVGLFSFCTK